MVSSSPDPSPICQSEDDRFFDEIDQLRMKRVRNVPSSIENERRETIKSHCEKIASAMKRCDTHVNVEKIPSPDVLELFSQHKIHMVVRDITLENQTHREYRWTWYFEHDEIDRNTVLQNDTLSRIYRS